MDNWLAKLAAVQPTSEESMQQALSEMPLEELQELAQEEPLTPNIDSFEQKVAEADAMGRAVAREQGPGLAAQAENRALQNHAVAQMVQDMPDDEAIKLAYILEHGSEQEKTAFLGSIARGAAGLAGKALKSGVGSRMASAAVNNPRAALAVGGAAAGGAYSKATGGSALKGAIGGAAMGGLAGRSSKITGGLQRGMMNAPGKLSQWSQGIPKVASLPLTSAIKAMVSSDLTKVAFLDGHANEWLAQFEGTPMLQEALALSKQEVELSMQGQAQPEPWKEQDQVRAQKKLLELNLIAQRNGLSLDGDAAPQEGAEEMPPEGMQEEPNPAEPQAGPEMAGPPMEAAQEQVKEAYASALFAKQAFVIPGVIGHYSHGDTQEERKASPRSGFWRGAGLGTLGMIGGAALGSATGNPGLRGAGALGGMVAGGYYGGKSAKATPQELAEYRAGEAAKLQARQQAVKTEKTAGWKMKAAKLSLPMPITGPRVTSLLKGKTKDLTHMVGKTPPPRPGSALAKRGLPGVAKLAASLRARPF